MNFRISLKFLGIIYIIVGISMLLPIGFGIVFKETAAYSLVAAMAVSITAGLALLIPFYKTTEEVFRKEGYFIVTFAWAGAALLGCLPFIFAGSLPNPVDAYFEAISGFTTTGSTVITDLTQIPRCILLWRSQAQWLGGMGIIVLVVALFSFFGTGGKSMFHSEAPGVYRTGIRPRIQDTAQKLWLIYVAITIVETFLLMAGGLSFYEALLHSFSTMATGGFSSHNESIAFFNSAYVDWVIIVFMFLAGTNFGLYYYMLITRKVDIFAKDFEWKFYAAAMLICTALITVALYFVKYYDSLETIRHAAFQVVSITTTTGFCTQDFDQWPQFVRLLLIVLMFAGGCTGSTGGGMKMFRVIVVYKYLSQQIYKMFHPTAILSLRVGDHTVEKGIRDQVLGFFGLAIMLFTGITLFVTCFGIDIETSFSATAATLWNIGPGLNRVGAVQNFAWLPVPVKVMLSFAMLAGRLELYTVLVLFSPRFWRT